MNLRQTFIDRVCNEEIETPWVQGSDEEEPHPPEYIRDDEAVKCKLEQTRLDIETRVAEKSSLPQTETEGNKEEAVTRDAAPDKEAETHSEQAQVMTPMRIPAELSTLLTQLTQRVMQLADNQSILQTAMENFTQNPPQAPAWSTRLDQTQRGPREVVSGTTAKKSVYTANVTTTAQTSPTNAANRLLGGAWGGGGVSRISQIRENCTATTTHSTPAPHDSKHQAKIISETSAI